MSNDELDHDNDEIKKFTENKTTKIDIISVTKINSQQFSELISSSWSLGALSKREQELS